MNNMDKIKRGAAKSNALAVQMDDEGKISYDVLIRQGHNKDRVVYSKLHDLLPKEMSNMDDPELQKPSQEEIDKNTEETKMKLEALTQSKISSALPVRCAEKTAPPQYIRYLPAQQGEQFNSGSQQRIIRMVEVQKDPMEPPKFKINQKIPGAPPSPPAPIMHSPPRKVTSQEQSDWKIPPCISSWKNAKGYTIPLDKRCAADGRSNIGPSQVNEKFAQLSEALYIATRVSREQVEMRAQAERKIAQKEKEKKEEDLRLLAQKAREQRASGQRSALEAMEDSDDDDNMDGIEERNRIRNERNRDRVRDVNLQMVAPERRSKLERQRERDISEQIALGVARPKATDVDIHEQRLYNKNKGLDSGFGEEDDYAVYDKPWKSKSSIANIYRPSQNVMDETADDNTDALIINSKHGDKRSESRSIASQQTGPIQFVKEDEDPFGLNDFLKKVKNSTKDETDSKSKRPRDEYDSRSKRRK